MSDIRSPRIELCTNNTAPDGSAASVGHKWMGGRGIFHGQASAYGTIKLQWKNPQGTWIQAKDVAGSDVSLAANGMQVVELPASQVRAVISGTTAAYAWLEGN